MAIHPQRRVFASGLEAMVARRPGAKVVSIQVYVWAGSLHEHANERGAAHFIEHMLFKGTTHRKVGEIGSLIESAGGEINAYTTFDRTVFYVTLPSDKLVLGLDVLSDAVFNSTFDAAELEREREVILEEVRRGNDDPGNMVGRKIFSLMYPGTEAGRPIIGSEESVAAMSRNDLLGFYHRSYQPNQMALVVVGNIDEDQTLVDAEKIFKTASLGKTPSTEHPKAPPVIMRQPSGNMRAEIIKGEFEQTRIEVAFSGPSMSDIDGVYVDLAAYVLGGSEMSRLARRLRDRDGLVSAIGASAYSPTFRGVFEISAAIDPSKMLPTLEGIGKELALFLSSEPPEDVEIERAKATFRINRIHREETVDGVARATGMSLMTPLKEKFEETFESLLEKSTADDCREGFARWFHEEEVAIVALGSKTLSVTPDELCTAFRQGLKLGREAAKKAKKSARSQHAKLESTTTKFTLPSGMPVFYRHLPGAGMFSLVAATEGGLRAEHIDNAGIFHAAAGMAGMASKMRSYDEFTGRLEDIGSVVSGFSGKDSYGWEIHTILPHAKECIGMFAEVLLGMKVPEEQWQGQLRETLHTMKMQQDSASWRCMRRLSEQVYGRHPYALPILGLPQSVQSFSAESLESHYFGWRDGGPWVLAAAGGLPPEEFNDLIQKSLKEWTPKNVKRTGLGRELPRPLSSTDTGGDTTMDKEQAHVALGFKGLSWSDKRRPAFDVCVSILGGHSGRLFTTLRERQSLAYSVSPLSSQGVDGGMAGAYIACKPDKVDQALAGMKKELSIISSELVSVEEWARAKEHILGSHEISLQRSSSQAMTMALMELYGVGWNDFEQYPEYVRAVTRESVLQVAKEIYEGSTPVEVIVGPR